MNRNVKKMAVSAVAASMILGVAAGNVLAQTPDHGKAKPMIKQGYKWERKFFRDQDDAPWALKSMIKMKGKKVFVGYEDGRFLPNKPITRAEAVVAAVRLMGLEDEAEVRGDVELHFKDAREIDKKYAWAEGYIAVALENGLFDSSLDRFEPQKPATREWVATLLVRALGLEQEALAKMTVDLPFRDKRAISAGAVGYVAVAVEKGLVAGYPDRTFRPDKPVTRAEMAALLDRMDWMDDNVVSGIKGQVYLVSPRADEIVVKTKSGNLATVRIDEGTYVFLDGKEAGIDDIRAGYSVTVVYDDDGTPLLIDLKSGGDGELEDQWLSGTIEELELPSAGKNGKLEVDLGEEDRSFALTGDTKVETDGLELHLSDLAVDQNVKLEVEDGVVKKIQIDGNVAQFEGEVAKVVLPTSSQAGYITLKDQNGERSYRLADVVTVVEDGKQVRMASIQVGDEVKIKTFESKVKWIEIVD